MTPDTEPKKPTADEIEAEAKIHDDHGNLLWANQLRELAAQMRSQQAQQKGVPGYEY